MGPCILPDGRQMRLKMAQNGRFPYDLVSMPDQVGALLDLHERLGHNVQVRLRIHAPRDGKAGKLKLRPQLLARIWKRT